MSIFYVALHVTLCCSWVRCVQSLLAVAESNGERFRYTPEEAAELKFELIEVRRNKLVG